MTLMAASWLGLSLCLAAVAWWAWRRRALPAGLPPIPVSVPWFELLGDLGSALATAPSRVEAVEALAHLLKAELGVSALRLFHVHNVEGGVAMVQPWSENKLLPVPQTMTVLLNDAPLGVAIQAGGVVGATEHGFAMAWPNLALDFAATGLPLPEETLRQLLSVAHAMVAAAARLGAPARRTLIGGAADPAALSQQLIESLPASMFVFEPTELRLMSINQEAEREFGLDRKQIIGHSLVEAFGLAASQVAEPRMREALAKEGLVECDYSWSNRLGSKTLQVRHRALRDPQGQPLLLLVVAHDVTAQRQTQRELQEATDRFLEFSESLLEDSLFIANPERDVFYFLAGSTYDLWGVTPEHVSRGDFFSNIIDEDRPLLQARADCERALKPADFVFRVQHPRKGLTFIRTRTRTNVMPDGSLRVYGVVSDVTKERAREDQLLAARDAAETASRAKSHFMANMSHEIRTPMNGILGMTELLLNTDLTDRQRHFAEAVYQSGESLLATLDDILDYAKLDAGRLELTPVDFVLRTVIEDTLELLAPRAHQKRLELNLREGAGTPEVVHGDPHRLRQILLKFVSNGIKFTNTGEVVVDVRSLPSDRPGWWLEFSVSDTGQGMEADVLPKLFTPFTQAEGGMSRQHEGVGLGLAIAGRLLELMGGTMGVHSTPGSGSVFKFALPFGAAQGAESELDTQHPQSDFDAIAQTRVLVVEDHVTSRQVLQHMLHDAGLHVSGVEDGQQALTLLQESISSPHPFDVALVDIHMPQLDGISLGRVLRQDKQYQNLKLILMSASASAEDVRQAQKIGFQGFLAKPVRRAELRQMIVNVCTGQKDRLTGTPSLSGRVLVVEDNVVNHEVICQMLRKLHLEVQMANSALQGLRALCEQKFDMVLMDIMMPGMDGVEALRWFKQGTDERFEFITPRETPVVAVTANALDGDEARFLALGFDGYLSKPLRQSQLIQMLSKHLPLSNSDLHVAAPKVADSVGESDLLLDQSALDRLRELDPRGENQLLQRVIGAFQSSVARLVPQLEDARRAGDLNGVRHVAHTFKSSSASVGATQLSQRCTELETLIRLDQVDNLDQRVEDLCKELSLVTKALQTLLDRQT